MSRMNYWGLSHPVMSMAQALTVPLDYAYAVADFIAHDRDGLLLSQAMAWGDDANNKGLLVTFMREYEIYWRELNAY